MNNLLQNRWSAFWFYGILLINLFLVLITGFGDQIQQVNGALRSTGNFSLRGENNVASWWSGMLLLIISLHAFDGYKLLRSQQPKAARGWALIALLFLMLSADEISSIHERANAILGLGPWLSLLPFAVIMITMLIFALISLSSSKDQRTRVRLLILGSLCFAIVSFQEYVEHNITWQSQTIRDTIAEGSELLGMMIFLRASISNTQGLFRKTGTAVSPTFEAIFSLRSYWIIVGLVAAPILAYITSHLTDHRGHPADWLAATIFFLAAIAACIRYLRNGENVGVRQWALTLACLFASASSVAIRPMYDRLELASVIPLINNVASFKMLLFLFLSLFIILCWVLVFKNNTKVYVIPSIIMVALIMPAMFHFTLFLTYVIPAFLGLIVYYVNTANTETLSLQETSPRLAWIKKPGDDERYARNTLRVLTYHRVAELNVSPKLDPRMINATPEVFFRQMDHLAKHYQVVSMEEVLDAAENGSLLPRRAVLITFDDAYLDFKQYAWPILKKLRLPATLFVPTAYPDRPQYPFWWDKLYDAIMHSALENLQVFPLGSLPLKTLEERRQSIRTLQLYIKTLPHAESMAMVEDICSRIGNGNFGQNATLGWDELRQLSKEGVTLGAHTRTHAILTRLPLKKAREEVRGSYQDLKQKIDTLLPIFSYPNGNYSMKIMNILREEGIKLAFAGLDGHNQMDSADPLCLHRTSITRRTSLPIFKLRLLRWFTYVDIWRHRKPKRYKPSPDLHK
ncbi:MAG: polysaccharide deacetylase family protein [bacterium]